MAAPTRRSYLGTLGTLVAGGLGGCLGAGSSPESSFSVRRIERVDVAEPASEYALSVEASLLEPELTPEHTARFRLEWTNEGERTSPELGLHCRPPSPLGTINERFHPVSEALLVPDHARPDLDAVLTCWVPPEHWQAAGCGSAGGCNTGVTLDPGETIGSEFTLWSHPEAQECLPAGRYLFGNRVDGACTPYESPFVWTLSFEIGDFE